MVWVGGLEKCARGERKSLELVLQKAQIASTGLSDLETTHSEHLNNIFHVRVTAIRYPALPWPSSHLHSKKI